MTPVTSGDIVLAVVLSIVGLFIGSGAFYTAYQTISEAGGWHKWRQKKSLEARLHRTNQRIMNLNRFAGDLSAKKADATLPQEMRSQYSFQLESIARKLEIERAELRDVQAALDSHKFEEMLELE